MSDRAAIGTEGTALELAFAFARCGYTAGNAQFARVAWSLVAHSWSWIKFAYSYRRNKGAESASASTVAGGYVPPTGPARGRDSSRVEIHPPGLMPSEIGNYNPSCSNNVR